MTNFFLLIHIFTLFLLFFFLFFLLREVRKSRMASILAQLYVFITFWMIFEFFTINFKFSLEVNTLLWRCAMISVYLACFFTLKLSINASDKKINKKIFYLLVSLIIFFSFFTLLTDKIVLAADFEKTLWGYSFFIGDLFWLSIIFYSIFLFPAAYYNIKNFLQQKDQYSKSASLALSVGVLLMILLGLTTNGLLPLLAIPFPKLASVGASLSIVVFAYAIYEWKVFDIKLEQFKIKNKIFLTWFIVGGILVGLGSISFYASSSAIIKNLVHIDLKNNIDIKKVWFDFYLEEKRIDLDVLSKSPAVRSIIDASDINEAETAVRSIENEAKSIAEKVDNYLVNHPSKTIKDLQKDAEFQEIAVQKIGLTGYSAVADYETLVCRFHTDPSLINQYLGEFADDFPDFWSIIKSAQGGEEAGGFYDWQDESGKIRKKFMYIAPAREKTADGVGLAVSANTYIDEYNLGLNISKDYDNYFRTFVKDHNYNNLFIINKDGIIVWEDRQKGGEEIGINVGSPLYPENYLKQVYKEVLLTKKSIISDFEIYTRDKKPIFYLAEPIFDEEERFVGVLIMQIKAEQINEVLQNRSGLGKTGETYLVGSDYLMRSGSIFYDYSTVLNLKVDTKGATNCLENKNNEVEIDNYKDYRNQSVVGAYVYLPEMDWCLMGEIDESEALAPVNRILLITVLSGLVFIVLIFIVSSWLGKIIAQPIIKLKEKIKIVEKGSLDYKVGTNAKDEVGELSRSFDKMTEAIKESRKEIDEKVKKQTEEIIKSREMMEDQQKAVLNVLEDVEEEKEKVSQEKDKINAILHSIGDGVFVVDENYYIIMTNQVTCDISGFSKEELIGKRYDEVLKFIYEKDEKINNEFITETIEKGIVKNMSNHTLLIHKNGDKVPVADSASPLKDHEGKIIGCVVVFRNVEKERQVDRAKTEFVSLASHQLLTPLTSIGWYVEMLVNGDAGKLNKQQKEFLDQIYQGNYRMVKLVNSLLNVSRIELGTFAVEPKMIYFSKIADSVIKEMTPNIKNKRMKVVTKYPKDEPKINADPKLIRIIFQNLLSNAVKYTQSKGEVKVEISVEKPHLVINVTDNGYGIPRNQQDKIFSKLFRADNVRVKDTTGTGLGLYIVKSIVDQAKGKISFKSKLKKGTTFTVKMPLSGMKPIKGSKKLE